MKRNRVIVLGSLCFAAFLFGVVVLINRNASKTVVEQPTSLPASTNLVKEHNYSVGPVDAPVTIVEFLDPECEACRSMYPIVKQLMREYSGKIRLVVRYMPFHGNSLYVAAALEEAKEMGLFEKALENLFELQPIWGDHHNPKPELIPGIFQKLGVDKNRIERERVIAKHRWKIDLDQDDGVKAGVKYTPTFFVNGKIQSEIGYAPLKQSIEFELKNSSN